MELEDPTPPPQQPAPAGRREAGPKGSVAIHNAPCQYRNSSLAGQVPGGQMEKNPRHGKEHPCQALSWPQTTQCHPFLPKQPEFIPWPALPPLLLRAAFFRSYRRAIYSSLERDPGLPASPGFQLLAMIIICPAGCHSLCHHKQVHLLSHWPPTGPEPRHPAGSLTPGTPLCDSKLRANEVGAHAHPHNSHTSPQGCPKLAQLCAWVRSEESGRGTHKQLLTQQGRMNKC